MPARIQNWFRRFRGAPAPDSSSSVKERDDVERPLSRAADFRRQGRFGDALRALCSSNAHADEPAAVLVKAGLFTEWGRLREARAMLARLGEAMTPSGLHAESLGDAFLAVGLVHDAIRWFKCSSPASGGPRGRCIAMCRMGEWRAALVAAEAWLENHKDDLEVRRLRTECLLISGDAAAAAARAQELLNVDDRDAVSWFILGSAMRVQGRHVESLRAFTKAVALRSDSLPHGGYLGLALAHESLEDDAAALATLRRGLAESPTPELHRTYGQMLLAVGRFDEGWREHEYRWLLEPLRSNRMRGTLPSWEGQSLEHKTIVIRIEQGFGDLFQFVRYSQSLQALGARVLLGKNDLTGCYVGVDGVLDESTRELDYYVNVMSLPRVFGTDESNVPVPVPYIRIPTDRKHVWSAFFGVRSRPRVGLVWAGNPDHPNDHNRSTTFEQLRPILAVGNLSFFSLQKRRGLDTAQCFDALPIQDLGPLLQDFRDTACVLGELDLLISVDTSVAHLAGALGRPVWLLLPRKSEWRWRKDRTDSAWYPTMRLFRQASDGDWDGLAKDVAAALQVWSAASDGPAAPLDQTRAIVTVRAPLPPDGEDHALSQNDDMLLQCLPNDREGGSSLAMGDACRTWELEVLRRFPLRGSTVVEAAAGVGRHTIPIARLVGSEGAVFAFEARRMHARLLKQNLEANDVANVSLLTRALATSDTSAIGPPCDTIDDLLLPSLDWIKLDLGFASAAALSGARSSIWRLRPKLMLTQPDDELARALVPIVSDFGYVVRLLSWNVETRFRSALPKSQGTPTTGWTVIGIPEEAADELTLLDPPFTGAFYD